jgi:hypothetical protein
VEPFDCKQEGVPIKELVDSDIMKAGSGDCGELDLQNRWNISRRLVNPAMVTAEAG